MARRRRRRPPPHRGAEVSSCHPVFIAWLQNVNQHRIGALQTLRAIALAPAQRANERKNTEETERNRRKKAQREQEDEGGRRKRKDSHGRETRHKGGGRGKQQGRQARR